MQAMVDGGLYDQPTVRPFSGPTQIDWIPLTIHVVRQGDGSGGAAQSVIDLMITNCNDIWAVAAMQFYQSGPTRFIDDDELYASPLPLDYVPDTEGHVPGTINIYLVPLIDACGVASYPWFDFQRIIIWNTCATSPSVLAHEVGHYFALFHTHDTFYGVECPDGSNGDVAGDLLLDTPADPNLLGRVAPQTCAYTASVPVPAGCDGDVPYAPDPSNVMSYAPAHCRTYLSPQQIGVARYTLEIHRPELIRTCPADLDQSGEVGFADLTELLSAWGACAASCPEDLDDDGKVGFADLTELLSAWGQCPVSGP
jgi:hypothetical protein